MHFVECFCYLYPNFIEFRFWDPTDNTLLKIFKGKVMIFLRCVQRSNFIIFENVLEQLCRAFNQIIVWPNISAKIIELKSVGWKNTSFPQIFWAAYVSIGPVNDLKPNWRRYIIWRNCFHCCFYASLGIDALITWPYMSKIMSFW